MRRTKALSMIFILVFSIFSIINFSVPAKAEQLACCEKTRDGDSCVYTDKDNCDSGKGVVETTCDKTSFCSVGCCYVQDEGECYKNVGKASCEDINGDWDSNAECQIQQCEQGCCIIGGEGSFVTLTKCKNVAANYPDAEMDFDDTITNEVDCINKARGGDKGACVSDDGKCVFTTRDECSTTTITDVNASGPKVGFWKDYLCSNSRLGTDCAAMQSTGCYNEDVYWFDSCGNKENIYQSTDGRKDGYNDGFVLSEENSCSISSAYDTKCGNCDYVSGTICGESPRNVDMDYGENTCVDLNCPNVYENDASPDSGGNKQHGESWCIYDASVGFGSDVVGSRHYRHLCVNGVELNEECKDYREEFCIEGVVGEDVLEDLGEVFKTTGEFTEAACRENRFEDCDSCNNINDCGGDCDEFEGDAKVACCAAECCSDITNKDCFFTSLVPESGETGAKKDTPLGKCVPHVPPGLKFWEAEGEAKSTCNKASLQCEVKWKESGMHRIGLGGDEDCVQNCDCLEEGWIIAANSVCIAQGDCGAWYNVAGELTFDGFSETHEAEISSKNLVDWDVISKYSVSGESYKFNTWQEAWDDLKAGLVVATLTGIGTAFFRTAGAKIGESFLAGFLSGGTGIGALISKTPIQSMAGAASKTFGQLAIKEGATVAYGRLNLVYEGGKWVYADGTVFNSIDFAGKVVGDPEVIQAATEKAIGETATGFTTFLQWVNTIMWIYTIYSLLDTFLTKTKSRTISSTCNPWVAPDGGNDCEQCNEDWKTCSEYRCKSLGKTCELVNPGTGNETCINNNPYDTTSPVIKPNPSVLAKNLTLTENPPDATPGFKINEKIEAYTQINLGITTDEPSQCKFALNASIKYDDLPFEFGDNLVIYNHTLSFALPSELTTTEALKVTNNGKYTLYVKCKDANGNKNERDYYIKFEIKPGADLTAPTIELTDLTNDQYVSANINETDLNIYLNEPANCKWNKNDTRYSLMSNSFGCATNGFEITGLYYGLYKCNAKLTNITQNKDNNYYIKCQDLSDNKNTMEESYKFTLKGSVPLEITSVGPKGTIEDNTTTLTVTTAKGVLNSTCGYTNVESDKENVANMIVMFENIGNTHKQELTNLESGSKTYYLGCIDEAGNIALNKTEFTIVQPTAPELLSIYKDTTNKLLHVQTNKKTTCQYQIDNDFEWGRGTSMTNPDSADHDANLEEGKIYYIKCRDKFDKELGFVSYT